MRKWFRALKLLVIIFSIMFIINAAVMHFAFGISIIELPGILRLFNDLTTTEQPGPSDPLDMLTLPESPVESGEERGQGADGAGDETHKNEEADASSHYAVLPEQISSLQQLSLKDKLTAMAILSKMGREEVNRIVDISRDGVTYDELDELIKSAEVCLEPSDIETLKELLPFVSLFPESYTP